VITTIIALFVVAFDLQLSANEHPRLGLGRGILTRVLRTVSDICGFMPHKQPLVLRRTYTYHTFAINR